MKIVTPYAGNFAACVRHLAEFTAVLAIVALASVTDGEGASREAIAGPVPADVTAVIDGDTLEVRARIWLGQDVATRVRLLGVDTPEIHGKCDQEREAAQRAKAFVEAAVAGGRITLTNIQYGKYAGRVVAEVVLADGRSLAETLIEAGLARAYSGGKRQPWCR